MENDLKNWLLGILQSGRANQLTTKELLASFGSGIFHIDGTFLDVHIKYKSTKAELYADIDDIEQIISFNQNTWNKPALTTLVRNIINSLKKGNKYRLSGNYIKQI